MGILKHSKTADPPIGGRKLAPPTKTAPASIGESKPAPLTSQEVERYATIKRVVTKGVGLYADMGRALNELKSKQLYRGEYESLDHCLESEWSMKRSHADRLIAAHLVAVLLEEAELPIPKSESVCRPLTSCKPALAKSVWQQLTASGHQPTADEVRSEIGKHSFRRVTKPRKSKTTKFRFGSAKVEVTPSKTMDVVTLLRKALAEAEEKAAPTRKAA